MAAAAESSSSDASFSLPSRGLHTPSFFPYRQSARARRPPDELARVLLFEPQTLIRELLMACLDRAPLKLIGDVGMLGSVMPEALPTDCDVWLVSMPSDVTQIDQWVSQYRQASPASWVVLDDGVRRFNVRQVLRLELDGYLTKEQPIAQISGALERAANGERVFAPEVAEQLVFSAGGVRLADASYSAALGKLTPRELDVLIYAAQGFTIRQTAETLGISESTADNHKSRLMKKLNIHKTVELAQLALAEGLIQPKRRRSEDRLP